jgi:hypothetical protein
MRKYVLVAALVLVSATAQAGATRGPNLGLNLASNDEPAATAAQPTEPAKAPDAPQAVETVKPAEAPKFVDRPAPVSTTADTPKAEVTKPAAAQTAKADKPKRRHYWSEARIIGELHRYGVYW